MNPPARDLAQYIANRSHIVVKAAVRAENEQGELLLIQHAEHGHWRIPAGQMRPGEAIEDTAHRELWEETGWTTNHMILEGLHSGPNLRHLHASGDEEYFVIAMFRAQIVQDSLVESRVNSEAGLKFFDLKSLPRLNDLSRLLLRSSGIE
ncbi:MULTISPECIES: NUDIX domain-containing protein [unclassified Paenibacillus]|uniref:NUDIX domain-containing protein n=1 Tax=unclassified Paenibacillus TaxID=185978 RepID=UPI0008C5FF25|nr:MULTISPECIES: NUDIX domain-containing protein [unclassified Paenibacillus]QLG41298.1 NUDIX domain-containing protein [Paenibacillus sp. E222]SEN30830.1 ADP-ribose pyrophosphatase YjhB, NUDIX family [Paenibacillus sp. OK076]